MIRASCSKHQEALKLFCEVDKEAICVMCQESWSHKQHNVVPLKRWCRSTRRALLESAHRVRDEGDQPKAEGTFGSPGLQKEERGGTHSWDLEIKYPLHCPLNYQAERAGLALCHLADGEAVRRSSWECAVHFNSFTSKKSHPSKGLRNLFKYSVVIVSECIRAELSNYVAWRRGRVVRFQQLFRLHGAAILSRSESWEPPFWSGGRVFPVPAVGSSIFFYAGPRRERRCCWSL
ncbi:uncharacterized protein LOC126067361 [Elephas maximus indicus]|uniref:uncharacterized protein LOC126067361 n=1 Tax=Elephas maximus indicus TaxID=99487 RepID=UPI0021170997|nr:uncharacterized protein LOC126067361 [Elephas maximus indicus]